MWELYFDEPLNQVTIIQDISVKKKKKKSFNAVFLLPCLLCMILFLISSLGKNQG